MESKKHEYPLIRPQTSYRHGGKKKCLNNTDEKISISSSLKSCQKC